MKKLLRTMLFGSLVLSFPSLSLAAPTIVTRTVVTQKAANQPMVVKRVALRPTTILRTLPASYKRVIRGGRSYYWVNGIYYVRRQGAYSPVGPVLS